MHTRTHAHIHSYIQAHKTHAHLEPTICACVYVVGAVCACEAWLQQSCLVLYTIHTREAYQLVFSNHNLLNQLTGTQPDLLWVTKRAHYLPSCRDRRNVHMQGSRNEQKALDTSSCNSLILSDDNSTFTHSTKANMVQTYSAFSNLAYLLHIPSISQYTPYTAVSIQISQYNSVYSNINIQYIF